MSKQRYIGTVLPGGNLIQHFRVTFYKYRMIMSIQNYRIIDFGYQPRQLRNVCAPES